MLYHLPTCRITLPLFYCCEEHCLGGCNHWLSSRCWYSLVEKRGPVVLMSFPSNIYFEISILALCFYGYCNIVGRNGLVSRYDVRRLLFSASLSSLNSYWIYCEYCSFNFIVFIWCFFLTFCHTDHAWYYFVDTYFFDSVETLLNDSVNGKNQKEMNRRPFYLFPFLLFFKFYAASPKNLICL